MTIHRRYLTPVRPAHRETFHSYANRVLLANHETPQHAAAMTRPESPTARKADMDATWRKLFAAKTGREAEQFEPRENVVFRHPDGTTCTGCAAPLPPTRTMCAHCSNGADVTQHSHFDTIVCVHHRRWVGLGTPHSDQRPASDAHVTAALALAKLRRKGLVDPRMFVLVTSLFTDTGSGRRSEYDAFPLTVRVLTVLTRVTFQRATFHPTTSFEDGLRHLRKALDDTPDHVIAGLWLYLRPTIHAVHQAVHDGTVYEPRWAHDLTVRPGARSTDVTDPAVLDPFKNYLTALTGTLPNIDIPRHIGTERPAPNRPETHLLAICDNGHEYERDRTKPTTVCPTCNNVPFHRSIAALPHLAQEYVAALNGGREPEHVFAGTSELLWWRCLESHTWKSTASNRTAGKTSCPVCRYKTVEHGVNDLATTDPELAHEWDHDFPTELSPTTISRKSHANVGWKCENEHRYTMPIADRVKGGRCLECAIDSCQTLAATHPDLVAEWHPEYNDYPPEMYTYGSRADVFWLCREGHTFRMRIERRTTGRYNCGRCSNRELAPGYNDLRTTDPELAAEYIDDLNERAGNRVIASNLSYWWTCTRNRHTYQQNVPNRRKSGGCPICTPADRILYTGALSTLESH